MKEAYRVLHGVKKLRTDFKEILVQVLVRQVAAEEDAVNKTVRFSEIAQRTLIFPLL